MLQLSPNSSAIGRAQGQRDRPAYVNMNQDEALLNLNDYNEILQSEVYVDLDRLRLLARHGVPNQLRGVIVLWVLNGSLKKIPYFDAPVLYRKFGNIFWVYNKPIDVSILVKEKIVLRG